MSFLQQCKYLHAERIQKLNKKASRVDGQFVAYWVQASQRTTYNHALEFAILKANELKVPLIAFFGLFNNNPLANQRQYYFMIQGLQQLKKDFEKRHIQFVIVHQQPDLLAIEVSKLARTLIVDAGYLRYQIQQRNNVAKEIDCEFIQVESDVMVPIKSASEKEEFAARTIRPKIMNKISYFQTPVVQEVLNQSSLKLKLNYKDFDITNIEEVIDKLKVSKDVSVITEFHGGELEAQKILNNFINNKLNNYSADRNDPSKDATSNLSMYLHFGMISPVYIHNEVMKNAKSSESRTQFLEELIVRRELSFNFSFYNENYDSYKGLPTWCIGTLTQHEADKRPNIYTREQLEKAQTHDEYWNSAQKEAICKGKIAGYMRMYWGKKVLQWSQTPEQAFDNLVYLNDKYHLDGQSANGYTGVAWCFGKHDRPWTRREIFGTIRYMIDTGLKRKFNVEGYVIKTDKKFREWKKSNGSIKVGNAVEETQFQEKLVKKQKK